MRQLLSLIISVMLLSLLVGCMKWPKHGTGGAADIALSQAEYQAKHERKVLYSDVLYLRLKNSRAALDKLNGRGVANCYPGLWIETTRLNNRIERELVAALYLDAYNDLNLLDKHILDLRRRMGKRACR